MTRSKAIVVVLGVLAAVGAFADLITISQYDFHLWDLLGGSSNTEHSTSLDQSASPRPTLVPTVSPSPTPTPVSPLDRQLEEALSVDRSSARNAALFIVAQDAVLTRDYWTAIRAAAATPSSSQQARSLAFVVRCAIEDGLYVLAAEAASRISATGARDSLKIEVIEARRQSDSEVVPSPVDRVSRESIACFTE